MTNRLKTNELAASGDGHGLAAEERIRLMRDGINNYSAMFVSGLVALVLVPILLRGLGIADYGILVAAASVAGIIGSFDLGLSATITREVAADLGGGDRAKTSEFVQSAGRANVYLALAGALIIATLGLPMSKGLHLSPDRRQTAQLVFALAAFGCVGDKLLFYSRAVLNGLRRFKAANFVFSVLALCRGVGIILLLAAGGALLAVAAWQAAVSMVGATAVLGYVRKCRPDFGLQLGRVNWKALRAQLPFQATSQLAGAASRIFWETPALVIGLVLGAPWITPYYIGQKFPGAASEVGACAAEVLFPAATEHAQSGDEVRTQEILEVGLRWIVLLLLPICMVLWLLGRRLLEIWVVHPTPESLTVMRLLTVAALADAIGLASLYILWGRSALRTLLRILTGVFVANLALGIVLVLKMKVTGAAWAYLLSAAPGSFALTFAAARHCRIPLPGLMRRTFQGLALPLVAGGGAVLAYIHWTHAGKWGWLLGAALCGGMAYTGALYWRGAREEERLFIREALELPSAFFHAAYGGLRGLLRRVWFFRSAWYLLHALIEVWRDEPGESAAKIESLYAPGSDVWGYGTPEGRRYLELTREFLECARANGTFRTALEIGCAQGNITEFLAECCESVVAVDISRLAISRARERFERSKHVRFSQWDVRRDPPLGRFQLVLVMGVLEYLRRPRDLRAAAGKIIDMVAPGGYLLVAIARQSEVIENALWSRWLIRGSRYINELFSRDPRLRVAKEVATEINLFTLCQKQPENCPSLGTTDHPGRARQAPSYG